VSLVDAQVVGLAGHALALAAGAAAAASRITRRRPWVAAAAVAGAVAATRVHVEGVPIAGYLRGTVGDLSITTLVILAAAVAGLTTGRPALDRRAWAALCGWAAGAGVLLYPLTLGLTRIDSYELGYRPRALLVLVAALVVAWWWTRRTAAVVLAVAVVAFQLRVLESTNLWDYLLDPPLAVCAIVAVGVRLLTWRRAPSALRVPAPATRRSPERPS